VTDERRRVLQVSFLAGGKTLASVEALSRHREGPLYHQESVLDVRFWDTASGEMLRSFALPPKHIHDVIAFSADGKTLAVGDRRFYAGEVAVHMWDTEAGKRLATLQGHTGPVMALAFSHDGQFLASGSADTSGLLWDLRQVRLLGLWSRLVGRPQEAEEAAKALAGSPEGVVPFIGERLREARAREAPFTRLIADLDSEQFEVRERASRELERAGAAAEFALRLAMDGQPSAEVRRRLEELLSQLRAPREARFERLLADLNSDDSAKAAAAIPRLALLDRDDEPYLRRALELPQVPQRGRPGTLGPRARQHLTRVLQGLQQESSAAANPATGVPIPAPAVSRVVKVLEGVGSPDARRALEELANGPSESRVTAEARAALRRLGKRDK
jgi:hypothetical protein